MAKSGVEDFKKKLSLLRTIGLDSMCFIYQFADHPEFGALTNLIFTLLEEQKISAVTSTVTVTEVFVKPEEANDQLTINEYEKVFKHLPNLEIIPVDFSLARLASKLRGRYRGIKTADSIQVAAALLKGCRGFITNDNALKQIKEIEVIVIKDFSFQDKNA